MEQCPCTCGNCPARLRAQRMCLWQHITAAQRGQHNNKAVCSRRLLPALRTLSSAAEMQRAAALGYLVSRIIAMWPLPSGTGNAEESPHVHPSCRCCSRGAHAGTPIHSQSQAAAAA